MSGTTSLQSESVLSRTVDWTFGLLFVVIGLLNLILVHPVPGIFYLLLSLLYYPRTHQFTRSKFGVTIPLVVRIVIGLLVLWGTLAVTDLADMAGL